MLIDWVPVINSGLMILSLTYLVLIDRKLGFLSNPLKEFSLMDDIERLRNQQITTAEELSKIKARVEETVQALHDLEHTKGRIA